MKKIEAYLQQFDNQYIGNLDQVYKLFEQEKLSIEQQKQYLKRITLHNENIYKLEQQKARNVVSTSSCTIPIETTVFKISKSLEKKKQQSIIDVDVSSYITTLKKCTTIEEIKASLPMKDIPNYEHIIRKILLYYYQYKVEIINLLNANNELTKEDIISFQMENETVTTIMDSIIDSVVQKSFSIDISKEEHFNQLIFWQNEDIPRVFDNIKNIDIEYYDSLNELFHSIKTGTFKGFKSFKNNDNLTGIYEVRGFKTRILFDRIDADKFVIIAAFIKKCDKDYRYRNYLTNMIHGYRKEKEFLKEQIKSMDFMKQQSNFEQMLFAMLENPKKKVLEHE